MNLKFSTRSDIPKHDTLGNTKDWIDKVLVNGKVPRRIHVKFNWAFQKTLDTPIDLMYRGSSDIRGSAPKCTLPENFGRMAKTLRFNTAFTTSLSLPAGFGENAETFSFFTNYSTISLPPNCGRKATNLKYCFRYCSRLTTLNLPDGFGAKATDISYCFYNCTRLTTLNLPDGFGAKAENLKSTFSSCRALTTITGNPNFKVSVDFSNCPLTTDSAMVIINGLQTVTTAQTLTLNATTLAALTDEQKAVATAKGWTLASV